MNAVDDVEVQTFLKNMLNKYILELHDAIEKNYSMDEEQSKYLFQYFTQKIFVSHINIVPGHCVVDKK